MGHIERLAMLGLQCFGQEPEVCDPEHQTHAGQKPEDALPACMYKKPAAHDGSDGWGYAKVDRHLAHHLLRARWGKHVADDRTRHHNACARRQALQCPERYELADAL